MGVHVPDYMYAIETDDMVNIREQPDDNSNAISQAGAGERMMAASEVEGGQYGGSRPGSNWYPVQYGAIEGYVAAGYVHVV